MTAAKVATIVAEPVTDVLRSSSSAMPGGYI